MPLSTPDSPGKAQALLVLLHLAAWKPQASGPAQLLACGLRNRTEGHEFRVKPAIQHEGLGKESSWPLCVGHGLYAQQLPGGKAWTTPRAVWAEPIKGSLLCWDLAPPFLCLFCKDPAADSAGRPFARASRECGRVGGGSPQRRGREACLFVPANCYHSPPQTMKSLENFW